MQCNSIQCRYNRDSGPTGNMFDDSRQGYVVPSPFKGLEAEELMFSCAADSDTFQLLFEGSLLEYSEKSTLMRKVPFFVACNAFDLLIESASSLA